MRVLCIFIVVAICGYVKATATLEDLVKQELEKKPIVTENAESNGFSIEYKDAVTKKDKKVTLFTDKMTFFEARWSCYKKDGILGISRTVDDLVKYVILLRLKGVEVAWIGVHDLYEDWDWVTMVDEPLDDLELSQYWMKGEPNHGLPDEHCVELWENGLNDNSCSLRQPYFCVWENSERIVG